MSVIAYRVSMEEPVMTTSTAIPAPVHQDSQENNVKLVSSLFSF